MRKADAEAKGRTWAGMIVLLGQGFEICCSTTAYAAGDVTGWANKMVNTATPIGLAMALFGFIVIGIAHSSHWGAEWAQRREKGAFKGAVFSIGAVGLLNLIKSIFG